MTTADEFSQSTGQTSPATMTSENLPQNGLLPMELPLMLLPEDSRAKTLALLESRPALAKGREADCGASAFVLLAKFDPNTQSLKMSQTCFLDPPSGQGDGSQQSCETWPASGMMLSGIIYQLPTLEPGIGGGEYGYLPTPTKTADSKGAPKNRFYGSPTCRSNLREVLRNGPDDPVYPHPSFVERIMGFPICATELPPLETP